MQGAELYTPRRQLFAIDFSDLITRDIPPRETLLSPWLFTQSINMMFAQRGVGKTHLALEIAYAVATGGKCLRWQAGTPRRVLYLDGEMPAVTMQERMQRVTSTAPVKPLPGFLQIITPDLQPDFIPDLSLIHI